VHQQEAAAPSKAEAVADGSATQDGGDDAAPPPPKEESTAAAAAAATPQKGEGTNAGEKKGEDAKEDKDKEAKKKKYKVDEELLIAFRYFDRNCMLPLACMQHATHAYWIAPVLPCINVCLVCLHTSCKP
jgi:hypothetical protein